MIAGKDAKNFGEAKNSWLTGTAAWSFVNVSQYLLGIKPTLNGLSINPCLPESFNTFEINRTYRGNNYHLSFIRSNEKYMIINGKRYDKNIIPLNLTGNIDIQIYY